MGLSTALGPHPYPRSIQTGSATAVHLPERYLHLGGVDEDLRQLLYPCRGLQGGVPFQELCKEYPLASLLVCI